MMQQHSRLDDEEERYRTVFICTCRSIPYWSCNGRNKLARHLLAMSVVCFYACNDTLNSVVDSPLFSTLCPVPREQCQQNRLNECALCFLCLFWAKIWF